jgi:hypothetical protein
MVDNIEIRGGAGPHFAAAIAAVVEAIDEQGAEASATPPKPIRQAQWIQAGRPLERQAPMASAEYDRMPGSNDGDDPSASAFL